ncbi:MAG: hypothetical protein ACT4QF_23315 [Sporichthyaceae bacterium]
MTDAGDLVHEFGRALIQNVRDRAIRDCDAAVRNGNWEEARLWRAVLDDEDARTAFHKLVPGVVDAVLFALLDSIDNKLLPLHWKVAGNTVLLEDVLSWLNLVRTCA